MNPDLAWRLTPFSSGEPKQWLNGLFKALTKECDNSGAMGRTYRVNFDLEEIENGEDDTAYVEYDGVAEFWIVIDLRCNVGTIADYLIHEMAHVDRWIAEDNGYWKEEDDHGPLWGESYAKMYRAYIKYYEETI